jgi:selenocysteine lyase/cysteine desulfurase
MYQQHYQRFLQASGVLHFAAHSHHLWPDCTRDAMLDCWDDAAKFVDRKWSHLFETVIPQAQRHVSKLIVTNQPGQIVFAPSTHEFVLRLLSCLDAQPVPRILTTTNEFHSFRRQVQRLEQEGLLIVDRVPAEPIETFSDRFRAKMQSTPSDLIFFSHVFFDSGLVVDDLPSIIGSAPAKSLIAIDAYHSFCALPIDASTWSHRAFILGGGYKYAQSGEGVCWMHVPADCSCEPKNTGWFASFETLADSNQRVAYSQNGMRFAGATFDPAGIYRFNRVMKWCDELNLTVEQIHDYVVGLQQHFLHHLRHANYPWLNESMLLLRSLQQHGHFFTFEMANASKAERLTNLLAQHRVVIDHRGSRARFGFGLYQTASDVDRLFQILDQIGAKFADA